MTLVGVARTLAIQLRTGWTSLAAWVLALGATMLATTASISGLYDTRAKMRGYAEAVGAGDALVAINGRVAGVDTLGGIVANEFGFVAAFAIPLMAISLVARSTRKDEERGRLETLLAGRIGRRAPVVAALLIAAGALVLVAGTLLASLVVIGVPPDPSLLYAGSMGALGLVFAGVAAVAAQLVEHSRGVYAVGLGALVSAYLLRGIGEVQVGGLLWLSPLGWQEKTRAFGDAQPWPLLISVAFALALMLAAVVESGRRDLGSAVIRRGTSELSASASLCTPVGTALHVHRGSMVGWAVAGVVVGATFGALAQPLADAITGNAALAEAMGASGASGLGAVLAMSTLLLALLGAGYAVQAAGILRAEETSGRLEVSLAGRGSRWTWLGPQVLVVALGIVVVLGLGGLALGLSATWSTGDAAAGPALRAVASYLPAVTVLGALGLLCFGVAPRLQPVMWLVYGVAAMIAYLGDALGLGEAVQDVSPFHLVGGPPQDPADGTTLTLLALVTVAFVVVAFLGFRRRDVPRG
jgi:ABC-2 type transport system permease protein